ncbi:MAG TPA: hypothetical protein PKI32_07435, partial [Opitutales bacterium]|nr:hypothetical protein [Opitutales bacterium]
MNTPRVRISRFRLSQSIALLILSSVVPMVAITIGVIMVSIEKDVDFGLWEQYGVTYQRPLESILDAAPLALFGPSSERRTAAGVIDDAFIALDKAQNEVGEALQFTREGLSSRGREAAAPAALRQEWEALRSSGRPSADAAAVFISHVRMAIAHSGDTSNLILDPDLDSYYLMDVVLCALPQTQDRLGSVVPCVSGWIAEGGAAAHASEIAAMRALLSEADIARIEG